MMTSKQDKAEVWRRRGVTQPELVEALQTLEYEVFVEDAHKDASPEVIARMIQALELDATSRVLQIGTGSGYTAALLGLIVDKVYSTESNNDRALRALRRLNNLAIDNVEILFGDSLHAYSEHSPYDAILVSVGMGTLPRSLGQRLTDGGVLIAPVGHGPRQRLMRLERTPDGDLLERDIGDMSTSLLLGDILVKMGAIDREEVEMAALEADVQGKRLGEALLDGQHVAEEDIYRALALQRSMRLLSAEEILEMIDLRMARSMPRVFLDHHRLMPVRRTEEILFLATSDPNADRHILAQALSVERVELALITPTDMQIAWSSVDHIVEDRSYPGLSERASHDLDARIIQLLDAILADALSRTASAIHLEHTGETPRARLRIDEALVSMGREVTWVRALNAATLDGLAELVRLRARLDISRRRGPLTGVFERRLDGVAVRVRAVIIPTHEGTSLVLNLTPRDLLGRSLDALELPAHILKHTRALLERNQGVLATAAPRPCEDALFVALCLEIAQDEDRKLAIITPQKMALPTHVTQIECGHADGVDLSEAMETARYLDADVLAIGAPLESPAHVDEVLALSRRGHLVLCGVDERHPLHVVETLAHLHSDMHQIGAEVVAVFDRATILGADALPELFNQPALTPPHRAPDAPIKSQQPALWSTWSEEERMIATIALAIGAGALIGAMLRRR